jgi:predicted HNH restriction endonuclease
MSSDWARITPFYTSLNNDKEVAPFARFLIDYSLPRAVSKRGNLTRNIEREIKLPEEVPAEFFSEGHASQITVNRYERDPKARAACFKHHGTSCAACGISMEAFYGCIAHDFIHVHHLVPLSARRGKYTINPKFDLIPLCPNCHAITHLANPPLSLDQLKIEIAK